MVKVGQTMLIFLLGFFQTSWLKRIPPPKPCQDVMCTDLSGYPTEAINNALKKNPHYKDFWGPKMLSNICNKQMSFSGDRNQRKPPKRDSISTRENYQQACEVTPVVTGYPTTARNVNNVTRYIVNTDNMKQPISTEKCRNEGGPCNNLIKYMMAQNGVNTSCRSRTVTVNLLVYDQNTQNITTDQFTFPTACVCYYIPID